MQFGETIGADTFRLERRLKAPIEKVWSFFVDADKRGRWFTSGDDLAGLDQAFTFAFSHHKITDEKPPARWAEMDGSKPDPIMNGRILAYDPPRLLAFTWGDDGESQSEVRFEFTAQGDETTLVLTHSKIDTLENARDFAGGWTAHINTLVSALDGQSTNHFWADVVSAHQHYDQAQP